MAIDLKAAILAADDISFEDVVIPEWGDLKVRVRGLDANDFTAATKSAQVKNGNEITADLHNLYAALVIKGLYDPETDLPVFTDADIRGVMSKSMKVIERITTIVNRLSGMDDKGSKEKALEAAGKD